MTLFGSSLAIAPLVPWTILGPLFALAGVVGLVGLVRGARGAWLRLAVLAVLAGLLLDPRLVHEDRVPIPDVALIVADRSPSQTVGTRSADTDAAVTALRTRLKALPNLEVRVVEVGDPAATETRLFAAIDQALTDVPPRRRAGVVLVTDGQVHDVPGGAGAGAGPADPTGATRGPAARIGALGPLHALITGVRDETDRRIEVVTAPSYGLVGRTVTVSVQVAEGTATGGGRAGMAMLTVRRNGGPPVVQAVPIGRQIDIDLTLGHAGDNVLELAVAAADGELTDANNRTAVVVNGVRDRLRVLLVSGEPYPGERTWRNLLKADPSVDLVHFTILRPPEKQDGTPINELSLIAFPIRELFEIKLDDFDLIIFDRYRQRGVLPQLYFDNIVQYVAGGGALLVASGPSFTTPFSLARTALGRVLPATPTGRVIAAPFRPMPTAVGDRHPVTAGLPGAGPATPSWGRWFRQIEVAADRGRTVLTGLGDRPLLILDRVGRGRVAQLASDQIWLWSRGYEGGGPHGELLRRLAHWLMKEPELEEDVLRARADGGRLVVERRSLEDDDRPVAVTDPTGTTATLTLIPGDPGRARGMIEAPRPGVYHLSDGRRSTLAVVGAGDIAEQADLRATAARLAPAVKAAGGSVQWLADRPADALEIARTAPEGPHGGPGWLGLRANGDYRVTGVATVPLVPVILALALALGTLIAAWVREGRQ